MACDASLCASCACSTVSDTPLQDSDDCAVGFGGKGVWLQISWPAKITQYEDQTNLGAGARDVLEIGDVEIVLCLEELIGKEETGT